LTGESIKNVRKGLDCRVKRRNDERDRFRKARLASRAGGRVLDFAQPPFYNAAPFRNPTV